MNSLQRTILFFSVLLLSVISIHGQNSELFAPLNFQSAIKNQTRTNNGMPGNNYWQNYTDYTIKAEILPDSNLVAGFANIVYHNESPDTLKRIIFRLYQDIYKDGALRDWYMGGTHFGDEVNIKYLIINGDSVDFNPRSRKVYRSSTNMYVNLENPLPPGQSLRAQIEWSLKISERFPLRMGNYGDGDFFIAYWYPQIAVYDDIDGWDTQEYEGSVEFYNDFSNFDIELTLPRNYVLWSTGELQNAEEIFKDGILKKIKEAKMSDETIHIINAADYAEDNIFRNKMQNTWKIKADGVTDVSFAFSDSYVWDAASVEVEENTGRRVLTSAVYEDSTIHYEEAAKFSRITIEYLSKELPGYPYSYPQVTSFCNKRRGGGMETPMMANDGAPEERASFIGLIFHEISHNYFPFMMGTNERKYAWMDEGWASFFPREVIDRYEPDFDYYARVIGSYTSNAGYENELPLIIPSYTNKTDFARTTFYDRPNVAYHELMQLLGRDLFKKALLEYISRWIGKHPVAWDFFNTFNDVTGEDLSWFWKPWFFEYGYPDLNIKGVSQSEGEVVINIEEIGNIPTSVNLKILYEDGSSDEILKSAAVWKDKKIYSEKIKTNKKVTKVVLGNDWIPDINKENNELTL